MLSQLFVNISNQCLDMVRRSTRSIYFITQSGDLNLYDVCYLVIKNEIRQICRPQILHQQFTELACLGKKQIKNNSKNTPYTKMNKLRVLWQTF